MIRRIVVFKENFLNFYRYQDAKTQRKIEYVFDLLRYEQHVPVKFFKSINDYDGIYEIRVLTRYKSIRIMCFFDQGTLIILTNCFVKKTRKIPKKELRLAVKLRKEYMTEKYGG